jgi:hypothetical protein
MDIPKVAIIKENSQFALNSFPFVWIVKGCPEIKAPIVELMDCPKMVIKVKISTGKHIHIVVGSINILIRKDGSK